MLDGIAVSFNDKKGGDWTRYSLFSTRIGKHWFLNVKDQDKTGKEPVGKKVPFFIVRYRIAKNNRLDLWLMPQDSAEAAIANGFFICDLSPFVQRVTSPPSVPSAMEPRKKLKHTHGVQCAMYCVPKDLPPVTSASDSADLEVIFLL